MLSNRKIRRLAAREAARVAECQSPAEKRATGIPEAMADQLIGADIAFDDAERYFRFIDWVNARIGKYSLRTPPKMRVKPDRNVATHYRHRLMARAEISKLLVDSFSGATCDTSWLGADYYAAHRTHVVNQDDYLLTPEELADYQLWFDSWASPLVPFAELQITCTCGLCMPRPVVPPSTSDAVTLLGIQQTLFSVDCAIFSV